MNKEAVQHERGPRSSTIRKQMAAMINENGLSSLLGAPPALNPSAFYLAQHNLLQQQALANFQAFNHQSLSDSPFTNSTNSSSSVHLFNPLLTAGTNSSSHHSTLPTVAKSEPNPIDHLTSNLNNNHHIPKTSASSLNPTTLHNTQSTPTTSSSAAHHTGCLPHPLSAKDLFSTTNNLFATNPWTSPSQSATPNHAQENSFTSLLANQQQLFNLIQMTRATSNPTSNALLSPYYNFLNLPSTTSFLPGLFHPQPSRLLNSNGTTNHQLSTGHHHLSTSFADSLHSNLVQANSDALTSLNKNNQTAESQFLKLSDLFSNHTASNFTTDSMNTNNLISTNINNHSNNSSTSNSSNDSTSLSSTIKEQERSKQLESNLLLQNLSTLTNANICCPTPKYAHNTLPGMLNICN